MRSKLVYAIAATVLNIGWGLHFAFFTRYIAVELRGGLNSMLVFTGLGWFFVLLGVLAGEIANRLGERKAILLGVFQALPILVGIVVKDPIALAALLSVSAFPWVVSWSVVLKVIFAGAGARPGREYSKITLGTGAGYAIGSMISGPVYAMCRAEGVFILNAVLLLAPPLMWYCSYPRELQQHGNMRVNLTSVVKKTLLPLISLTLVVFTRELLYSLAPVKLNTSIEEVLPAVPEWAKYSIYGLVYSGGALISPAARLLAGYLVDTYGPLWVYVYTTMGYLALYWSFTSTSALIPLLLWQIPLYPMLDTAYSVYIAKKLSREELVTGFATAQAFTAIGGMLVLPLLYLGDVDPVVAGVFATLACVFSTTIMLVNSRRDQVMRESSGEH